MGLSDLFGRKYDIIGTNHYYDAYMDIVIVPEWANGTLDHCEHISLGVVQFTVRRRRVTVFDSEGSIRIQALATRVGTWVTDEDHTGSRITLRDLFCTYADARYRPETWQFCSLDFYRHASKDAMDAYRHKMAKLYR